MCAIGLSLMRVQFFHNVITQQSRENILMQLDVYRCLLKIIIGMRAKNKNKWLVGRAVESAGVHQLRLVKWINVAVNLSARAKWKSCVGNKERRPLHGEHRNRATNGYKSFPHKQFPAPAKKLQIFHSCSAICVGGGFQNSCVCVIFTVKSRTWEQSDHIRAHLHAVRAADEAKKERNW